MTQPQWRTVIMRDGKPYTINLYDTEGEAWEDLPKVRRHWGQSAYVEKIIEEHSVVAIPIEEPSVATDHSKEWFQVTIVLGNFQTREEAAEVRSRMQTLLPNTFISGAIRGSWH